MDIKWAFASAVRREKNFMERTGRTSLVSNKDTKYGFDKQVMKCFRCGERGHFKRECTRPSQYGNQNTFRNQTNQLNQTTNNTKCAMVPVGNSNQTRFSNANNTRALVVQADKNCDWSVQLGSGGSGGTACYAKVIQRIKHVQNGDSSEEEGSSGYSEALDEESSSDDAIEEMSSETIDVDVEKLLSDAESMQSRRSILWEKATV
ncbi:putative transcription factor interactor and regulator CCHC(Zn) family [Helianthus annuus]|nr:putative transcription factor interactor and regulator CCHC(Zn) family [Helianthus annuus]